MKPQSKYAPAKPGGCLLRSGRMQNYLTVNLRAWVRAHDSWGTNLEQRSEMLLPIRNLIRTAALHDPKKRHIAAGTKVFRCGHLIASECRSRT